MRIYGLMFRLVPEKIILLQSSNYQYTISSKFSFQGVSKRVVKAAKRRGCGVLSAWHSSINRQFYWAISTSKGDLDTRFFELDLVIRSDRISIHRGYPLSVCLSVCLCHFQNINIKSYNSGKLKRIQVSSGKIR